MHPLGGTDCTDLFQVFDALRHDFNTRRRERCVRLDFPLQPGQGSVGGLEDLEQLIKAAIKASFETRAAAYEEEASACDDHLAVDTVHRPCSCNTSL